jgi:fluoride ion exporter CrcB/FEX
MKKHIKRFILCLFGGALGTTLCYFITNTFNLTQAIYGTFLGAITAFAILTINHMNDEEGNNNE